MVQAKRNKVSEEGMTDSQRVVEDGGGIRNGFLEKVAFGLGHVGSVGFMHRQYEEWGLPSRRVCINKGTEQRET